MLFDLFKSTKIATSKDLSDLLIGPGYESISGVHVTKEAALKYAAVFSCIRVLAESFGQLPFFLYENKDGIKEKATTHRLYKILHYAPNHYQTSQEWREMIMAHWCLKGNHYCFINRVRGEIRELLPLNPDAVEPLLDDNYRISYKVTFANGTQDVLSQDKVFHIPLMSTDGLNGLSIIGQMRNTIGVGISSENYGAKLFSNGARPGGILSTDQELGADTIKLIRDEWQKNQGGIENAHKAAILQGGLKWTAIGMDAEDAQWIDSRKFNRSEIAGGFRVPPHKIGDLEKATFSNIEQLDLDFYVNTITPYLTRTEQRAWLQLLNREEKSRYFAKFSLQGILRGDMKSRSMFYNKMFQMGVFNPNEIREFEDLNARDGGDQYYVPMNMESNQDPDKETEDEK